MNFLPFYCMLLHLLSPARGVARAKVSGKWDQLSLLGMVTVFCENRARKHEKSVFAWKTHYSFVCLHTKWKTVWSFVFVRNNEWKRLPFSDANRWNYFSLFAWKTAYMFSRQTLTFTCFPILFSQKTVTIPSSVCGWWLDSWSWLKVC